MSLCQSICGIIVYLFSYTYNNLFLIKQLFNLFLENETGLNLDKDKDKEKDIVILDNTKLNISNNFKSFTYKNSFKSLI